ncbi:MAG: BTAD domain-containing putative transcriptional regulator, partial [Pseudonocardiaceae bacterium]
MTLLSRQGRRAEALDVYRRLVRSLDVELRVAPDRLSSALAKQLGSDDSIGTPASAPREVARRLQEQIEHLAQQRGPETARRITRLSGHRALALDRLGRSQEALTLIEGAQLAAVEGGQTAELARLLVAKAQVYQRQGHSGLAENAASEGQRLAEQTGERGLVAWSQRLRAQAAQHMGDGERAIGLARSSTALYLSMGLPAEALRSRRIVALTVWYSGRHREAETLYRQDLEEARMLLDLEQQAYILCGLGSALRALGSLDSAQTHLLEALALATRLEEHFLILSVEYHLANLWVDRADTLHPVQSLGVQRAREVAQRRCERVRRLAQAS